MPVIIAFSLLFASGILASPAVAQERSPLTPSDAEPGDILSIQWATDAPDAPERIVRYEGWGKHPSKGTERAFLFDFGTKKAVSVVPPWLIAVKQPRLLDATLDFYDDKGAYLGTRSDRLQANDVPGAIALVKAALIAGTQPGSDSLTPSNSTAAIPGSVWQVRVVVRNLRGIELGQQIVGREP